MNKQEFKALTSRFRKELKEAHVRFDVHASMAAYKDVRDKHFQECKELQCLRVYHIVHNRPFKTKPISVVEGFRKYPDLKSFRCYNNLRSA